MSGYQHIRVEPISTALGAMIRGIDCKAELPDQVIAEIRSAWLEHLVVFFPEQDLSLQNNWCLPNALVCLWHIQWFRGWKDSRKL